MTKRHKIIYVPGLHDQHPWNKTMTKLIPLAWKPYHMSTVIVGLHWEEGTTFRPKLQKIVDKIDELYNAGYRVSLVGQSAGGSAILNAFALRKHRVTGVINVTGRLQAGENVQPSLTWAARTSPAFQESVLVFEQHNEKKLTAKDRQKILTIRPFIDEIVPASTVGLAGATNLVAPFPEHSIGGVLICMLYARQMMRFLRSRRISNLN